MTAPFEVLRPAGRVSYPLALTFQADKLHALLLAGKAERTVELARESSRLAVLTSNPSEGPSGLDRAMSALNMYAAQEAIEEIEHALARIADGRYGTCQSCDRAILFARLEAIPEARFCTACPTTTNSSSGRPAASRLGPDRGGRPGAPPAPGCSPQPLRQSVSHRSETRPGGRRGTPR